MSDTEEDSAEALVGKTLGKGYLLTGLIGQGAMGAVYRASSVTGALVAVKTLRRDRMGEEGSQRFLRESELVRGLKHPHVVRTLDSGVDAETGLMFLVMPLVEGRDLDHYIDELGALEPESAVRIILQAARGLSAAHRIGIIHRDVKPGNLILDSEENEIVVRVCDFGIAKKIGSESSLTKTGSQLGTPDYVSPEQLKSSKHVDERTDVWSLGATLYQALSGAPPFSHVDSVFDLISAIISEDVPHLQDKAPWVDPQLALVVHKALQKDPNGRWATLEDMADALRPFSGGDELLRQSDLVAVSAERKKQRAERADLAQAADLASIPALPLTEMDELGLFGKKLDGRYLVKRLIGKGGMGNVYEVETDSGERLAAKVVSAGMHGAAPATLQRFAREAKSASIVNSANVARTLDAGSDEKLGFPFIIMELLSGVDLSSVMKREGALSPEVAVRLIVQAARGVAAAHAKGVVHRDIKPANLFLQQDKSSSEITVKVCDFGVAKRVSVMGISNEGRQSLTRSGGMVGSPMYMSPEQARNAKAVDERTDIWSLAVVLWEALSGQRFWAGQRALGELIIAICTDPIQRLEDAAPWVPHELCQAVHRALERDPKNRTQTVRAFIEDIEVWSGRTDRVVMSQLVGLTESQRSELTLKASLSQAQARRSASPSKPSRPPQNEPEIAATSTIGGDKKPRQKERSGSGSAMLTVALLSAAIAGGSAYYFARRAAGPQPAAPATVTNVLARVQIEPSDATVITPEGNVPVLAGEVVLRGRAGETLRVTLQRGAASKTFSVSLGSDGLASPARLSLGN